MYPSNTRGKANPPPSRAQRAPITRSASTSAAQAAAAASAGTATPGAPPRSPASRPRMPITPGILGAAFPPHMLQSLGGPIPDPASVPRGTKRTTFGEAEDEVEQPSGTSADAAPEVVSSEADSAEASAAAEDEDDGGTVILDPPRRPSPRSASSGSSDGSGFSQEQVDKMLRISEERAETRLRTVMNQSQQRFEHSLAQLERSHREKLDAITRQTEIMMAQLSQQIADTVSRPDQPRDGPGNATTGRTEQTPSLRARFSGAHDLFFGVEETPLPPSARSRPMEPPRRAPSDEGASDQLGSAPDDAQRVPLTARTPRRFTIPKPEQLGRFDGRSTGVYDWWLGVVNYMQYTNSTRDEVFSGLPGCFSGDALHWFNHLFPKPETLEEFRLKIFESFARDESLVRDQLDARKFDPEREKLTTYLADKLNLVSELHVSRGVSRRTLRLEPFSMDALMTRTSMAEAISIVHQGLPADWALLTEGIKDGALDWSDYRAKMLGREARTKAAIDMLGRRVGVAARAAPRARTTAPTVISSAPASHTPVSARHNGPAAPARPRPTMTEEDQAVRKLDRELGRCFQCHQPGHSERDCPDRKVAINIVRQVLSRLEHGEEGDDDVIALVRHVEAEWATQVQAHPQDADGYESEDGIVRVKNIRAVSLGPDDVLSPAADVKTGAERLVEVPGRRHRNVVAHKVAVYLDNERDRLELHVDGGSPLSMITERALRTIAPDASLSAPEPLKIKGYRGDEFQRPFGVAMLRVHFPTSNGRPAVQHTFEFHVVRDCAGGWLLGVDNMKADGIDALSKQERLVFEKRPDALVPLLQTTAEQEVIGSPNRLVCRTSVRIEPHTTRVIEVDPVGEDRVVNPCWFTHEEAPSGFVKVPSCLIGPETRGVEVSNNSDVAVDLCEGDVLGETEPLHRQIGEVSELLEALAEKRRLRRAGHLRKVVRAVKAWQKSERARPKPFAEGPARRIRRLSITEAEPEGGDVLPEIDLRRPEDNEQKVFCSGALSPTQRKALLRVLSTHAVWPTRARPIGLYEYGPVSLRLRPGQEHWTHTEPPRRTSPAQKGVINETLAEHEKLGISEPSQGRFASGVVLVQQRDKIRFCNDYRPLNRVTVDDFYNMPTVDVIFDQFGKSRFFTVVDANKRYYQLLLDEESRDLTGFITYRGLRRYRRMPFGLKQTPSWFQRAMDRVLGTARWQFALAYLDDIVIYSVTFEEHLMHLSVVLAALERAGLTISPSKCRFAFESVALLGYKVNSLGLMTDADKTRAVIDFPEPQTAAEARRFFAMAAWYRRFVKNFAARARPINRSFVGTEFTWAAEERESFRDLKEAITSSPVLVRPEFRKPFILAVDASKQGLGGVLLQQGEDGVERPVVFISRQTTDGEKKYAPTHLELAAVWWCIKKLFHYVDGSSVEVRTDHNALRWLWDLKPSEITEPRVQKYKMALAPLENKVTISYNKGKDNVVADALSRAPVKETETEPMEELTFIAPDYDSRGRDEIDEQASHTIRSISSLRLSEAELASWSKAYSADPNWRRIWKKARQHALTEGTVVPEAEVRAGHNADEGTDAERAGAVVPGPSVVEPLPQTVEETGRQDTAPIRRLLRPRRVLAIHRGADDALYFVKDGLLFSRSGGKVKLCVPRDKVAELVHEYHKSIRTGHPSAERTYESMKDHLFAHELAQNVASHVRSCYECQTNKTPRHKPYGKLEPIITPHESFHTIGMDFVTGLPRTAQGHDSVMVVAYKYSRFGFFVPNKTTDTAEQVAERFLNHVFPVTGLPRSIISDRDSRFTSSFWAALMKELDVKLAMSTAFHAQTDGLVERLNSQLETMLRHYVAIDQHDWDTKLAALSMAYNSRKQESTGESPYRLIFNREPNLFPLRTAVDTADPNSSKLQDLFAIHADAQAAMDIARERQRAAYNSKHTPMEFNVGDAVLINLKNYRFDLDPTAQARAKLGPRLTGPFKVKRRIGRQAYELDVPSWFKSHPVLPVTALEPFHGDPDTVTPRIQAGTAASGAEPEVRVLGFVGRRQTLFAEGDKYDYLVKWAGPAATWQCDTRLPGLGWAVQSFEQRARKELGMQRLRRNQTIILPEAKERAADLQEAENTTDAARTQGSPLGGGAGSCNADTRLDPETPLP